MPTSTFHNLPQEKKELILSSAKKEFSRVPFGDASINRIIQDAEISRGSFYMYFEDKKDLFFCLLNEYTTKIVEKTRVTLKKSDGDIFSVFIELFDSTFEFSDAAQQDRGFLKNLFISMHTSDLHPRSDIDMHEIFAFKSKSMEMKELMDVINTDRLNLKGAEDIQDLISILLSITKHSISQAFVCSSNSENVKLRFIKKINMVKYGVLRDKS